MPTQIADPRVIDAMTAEQADRLFADLAALDIKVRKAQAAAEKKVADVKRALEEDTAADVATIAMLAQTLSAYVLAHRDRFQKPRQRKTRWGSYGLRTATKLVVHDQDRLLDIAAVAGADVAETTVKVRKELVQKAIADGVDFKGACEIVSGDIASYTVDRTLQRPEQNN